MTTREAQIQLAELAHWTDTIEGLAAKSGLSEKRVTALLHAMLADLGLAPAANKKSQGVTHSEKQLERRLRDGHRRSGALVVQWYRDRVDVSFRPEFPAGLLDTPWERRHREHGDELVHLYSYGNRLDPAAKAVHHNLFGLGFVESRKPGRVTLMFKDKSRELVTT